MPSMRKQSDQSSPCKDEVSDTEKHSESELKLTSLVLNLDLKQGVMSVSAANNMAAESQSTHVKERSLHVSDTQFGGDVGSAEVCL